MTCPPPSTIVLPAAAIMALACAAAKPSPIVRLAPERAVAHARGEQVGVAARDGTPDAVRLHTASGVTQWVYCGDADGWVQIVDFDVDGNVLVSLDLLDDNDPACSNAAARARPAARRADGKP